MHKSFCLFIFFLGSLIIGCGSTNEYSPGKIYDSIACAAKPEQNYALYLPSHYTDKDNYPIVFFFDPSARGKFPLEKYRSIADSLGIILAGSNISKNGPVEISQRAAEYMIADVQTRFPNVDKTRTFLSGFSGGSRFAYSYNLKHPEIKGVIGCGASLPSFDNNVFPPRFNYVLAAGFSDFNFREIYQVKEIFRSNNRPICFIAFDGNHEWTDSVSFYSALLYQLCLTAEKKNTSYISAFEKQETEAIRNFRRSKNLVAVKWCMENLFDIQYGFYGKSDYYDSLTALSGSDEYRKQMRLFDKSLRTEDSLTQEITAASTLLVQYARNSGTQPKNFNWWVKEIAKFSVMEQDSNVYTHIIGKRLKSQICIQLWEVNRMLVKAGLYTKSLETSDVLILANPDEPIYYALKAESYTALNRIKNAKEVMKIAFDKGFSYDEPTLKGNAFLQKLKN